MGAPSEPVAILSFSYVGIIQIRYKGRSSQLPLSLFTSSPAIQFTKTLYHKMVEKSICRNASRTYKLFRKLFSKMSPVNFLEQIRNHKRNRLVVNVIRGIFAYKNPDLGRKLFIFFPKNKLDGNLRKRKKGPSCITN